jgi:hypothetical protein
MRKALEAWTPDPNAGLSSEAFLQMAAKLVESGIGAAAPQKPMKSTEQAFSQLMPKSESRSQAPAVSDRNSTAEGRRKEKEQVAAFLQILGKRYKELQEEGAQETASSQPVATQPSLTIPLPTSKPGLP